MSRKRQIYNIWGIYASDAPATGYSYRDYNNEPTNDSVLGIFDSNALKQIDRVNSFDYSFNIERINLTQLGERSLVDKLVVNRPSININFNYYLVGVRNEARLGMMVNYPDITGKPILGADTCCFNNFANRETDSRNIFIAIRPDEKDLNNSIGDQFYSGFHPSGLSTVGFGNCYFNSYRVSASIGNLPQASVGYICDNVIVSSSGSGVNIPAVLPKSGNLMSGVTFTIPRATSVPNPSVLLPGDITAKILDINTNQEISSALFGINSSGVNIQSFELSVNLNREDLRSIGYALPIDRKLTFPIDADFSFSSLINNNYSGNLQNILNNNTSYCIQIDMRNPGCGSLATKSIAVQYKLKPAKLNNITYKHDLRGNLIGNFNFSTEIDINNDNKGLFVSGLLNVEPSVLPYYFLLLENNKQNVLLLAQDGNPIIISQLPVY